MNKKNGPAALAQNKKARHLYEFLEFMEAGMVLTGSEVKSLRAGHVSFNDAYVTFRNGEAFLIGLHIAPYKNAGYDQHEPDRDRKLLLHAGEIHNLMVKVEQKGLTMVPVNLHFKHGRIKAELALCRGKKIYDQRDDLKRSAENRDLERELARY